MSPSTPSTAPATETDETIVADGYIIQVMRCGRGYWASLDGQSNIAEFACIKSYAVAALKERVEAMRCESCFAIEGTRHQANCG